MTWGTDDWQDLPAVIMTLIYNQAGLKFNTKPIESHQGLKRAYCLPYNFIPEWDDAPEALGIIDLAISVLFAYGRMISRNRQERIDELLILHGAPYDTLYEM